MVAYYTNRTLLAPMARLGDAYDFGPFDQLRERYLSQDAESHTAIFIPWSSLFDLDSLRQEYNVRIIEKTHGHTDGSSNSGFGASPNPDMIHFVNMSQSLRSWKIYDKEDSTTPLGSYSHKLTVRELQSIHKPLLYFGSMFGGGRVMASIPEHQLFQSFMRQQFKIINPILRTAANTVIDALGGPDRYVALQVLSVGRGKGKHEQQLDNSIQSLLSELDLDEMLMGDHVVAGRDCLDDLSTPKLYLATDLSLPYANPTLTRLRALFPCSIAYQDLLTWGLIRDPLADMVDNHGRHIGHFFIPLVDGMVASKANKAVAMDNIFNKRGK
ncbi:hypothetical protein Unana1_08769 [Umbelopsis nana]